MQDFDVEPHSNCSYDYVALYDGANESAPLIILHCGADVPSPNIFRSTGNQGRFVKFSELLYFFLMQPKSLLALMRMPNGMETGNFPLYINLLPRCMSE